MTRPKYIYCIPFDPTGKKSEGKRKSQTEKLEELKQKQLKDLQSKMYKPAGKS